MSGSEEATEFDRRVQIVDRTHRLGVLSNAGLALLKLVVGLLAGSPALLADGLHSVSDVIMNAGAWLGSRLAARPRDVDHHYGHGNLEALATVLVGLVILAAGGTLIAVAFRGQSQVEADLLGAAALAAEVITIAVKLMLARVTARRGRELHSSLLTALARDNRSDILTSTLVLLAIAGSIVDLRWIEPIAAVAIGVLIMVEGLRSIWEGLGVLTDRHTDTELSAALRERAGEVEGVRSVDDLRVHPLGTHLRIDLEIGVDPGLDVVSAHAIAHAVERSLCREFPSVREVAVHVNPHA
jgi:cation diffusion facilitator family transporter